MKQINGHPDYYITETGEVWSHKRKKPKQLKPQAQSTGYYQVRLDGKQTLLHRLVAEHYFDNWDADLEVDHLDRDKSNNNLYNLRLVTSSENKFNQEAKGYFFHKKAQKWCASITVEGQTHHLGYYFHEHEARAAYLKAKEHYHRYKV